MTQDYSPEIIEFVGNGVSIQNYYQRGLHVWTANMMQFVLRKETTLPFWMDDFRHLEALDEKHNKYGVVNLLDKEMHANDTSFEFQYDKVVSSRWYHDHAYILEYPLQDVMNYFNLGALNRGVWTNTPTYMLAVAIWGIKSVMTSPYADEQNYHDPFKDVFGYSIADVKEFHLHGIDFANPGELRYHQANAVTFWIGVAQGLGIKVRINPASFLLNSNNHLVEENRNFLYGYNKVPSPEPYATIPAFIRRTKEKDKYGFRNLEDET